MKITKSQLRQLVMEELSEQMPETAEGDGFGETLPAAMYVSSAGNEVTFTVKVSKVDERTVDIDGLDMAIQRAYEQGSHESGPDTPDDLAGMEEAKSWKAQRRAAFHAANDEYLKTHDKEWWDAHEKRAKEDEYKPDPHGKYAREKASDDMAKGGVKEGRISKSALNAIIAEEYNKLTSEAGGYATSRARRHGGGYSASRGGEPTGDEDTGYADWRQDQIAAGDREHAARMAKKATPQQRQELYSLLDKNPKDELVLAALSVISLGNILTRKDYPGIFKHPEIAAIFEK